ncbi:MAG: hypothetical protein OXB93_00835 [Cytophagales bacterium]|nr:hypothetical protein [Cytophagales bacterium]
MFLYGDDKKELLSVGERLSALTAGLKHFQLGYGSGLRSEDVFYYIWGLYTF